MNDDMRAVRVHEFGGPEELVLESVPIPAPERGEVLVRVVAAGVGPWDASVRSGASTLGQTLPLTPGSDIAGVVERTAEYESPFRPGDEVFGVTNASFTGGYAEYARASIDMIACKPKRVGFVEAASAPVVSVTAWQMLFEHARVKRGQRVMILGAAGNVGAYAVQLAHWSGARVTAVGVASDAAFAQSIGAEAFVDSSQRLEDAVAPVDAVIDTVGGDLQERSFTVLKRGGAIVSSVSSPSPKKAAAIDALASFFIVCVTRGELSRIADLIDAGELTTDVGTVLSLDCAQVAHRMLAGEIAHARGKIVLDIAVGARSSFGDAK